MLHGYLRQKKMLVVAAIGILFSNWYSAGVWNCHLQPSYSVAKKERLKVMTMNANGQGYIALSPKDSLFNAYIATENPDVLCFQELAVPETKDSIFRNKYPVLKNYPHILRFEGNAMVMLSRFPMVDKAQILLARPNIWGAGAGYADILLPDGQKVRLFDVHLKSNQVTSMVGMLFGKPNLSVDTQWNRTRNICRNIRQNAEVREEQVRILKKAIEASPYPVVVAGDFNDVPLSNTIHVVSKGLKDAFMEKGSGLGFTYREHLPFLRIDYIFCSPAFEVYEYKVCKDIFSDHRPNMTTLLLPSQRN